MIEILSNKLSKVNEKMTYVELISIYFIIFFFKEFNFISIRKVKMIKLLIYKSILFY